MYGLMQDHPLLISGLLTHAASQHPGREVVSRMGDASLHRTTYAQVERRARALAEKLESLGIQRGDRVATLAWNGYRHLECFYGVSGMGAVLHTVNPRLFHDQISYIIRHAEDRVLMFDADLLPIVAAIAHELTSVEHLVMLCARAELPARSSLNLQAYEDWIDGLGGQYQWPSFDERLASSLCYTSGTTGNPKGVLYHHRSTILHALACTQADTFALGSRDTVLPFAPMFHANAWGMPYCAALVGARLVLPGRHMDAKNLADLLIQERVTFTVGVPTIWTLLLNHLRESDTRLKDLSRCVIAGTAMAPSIQKALREVHGATAIHAWGMTEISPIGTVSTPTPETDAMSQDQREETMLKQGRTPYGVQIEVRDPRNEVAPRDGKAFGPLMVRGAWVASGYFKGEGGNTLDACQWFATGDVATWDANGFMKITDRTKDVIKSGGEWISSIDVENAAMSHPGVKLAATVAAYHPKWDERPVLVVVPSDSGAPSRQEIIDHLTPRMAKWWLPDDVVFVKEMPMNATGKILKAKLREQYWHHLHAG
ncbi:MAG: long-chain-fatty-acid--CoA ligase [Proteobacteria bacterium]|nr:long-chain-fatty-acid--CoA ligase [Pseudomonadota bacterium]